jgi:hypothetical protein
MNNETEQPDALDRITIETRTMLALEKIALELEKLNLETYMVRMKILANQYDFSKEFNNRLDKMFTTNFADNSSSKAVLGKNTGYVDDIPPTNWHQGSGHPTANEEDCPWCNP